METGKIHIIHTNDIHSHFEAMPHIAGAIRQLKRQYAESGDQVIVADLGDHADRMHFVTEGTWGSANIEIMNMTGYDLAAIGNNEGLTFPKDRFKDLYKHAKFQVLCCNMFDLDNCQIPQPIKPYVIQQVGPLRLGWISATAAFRTFYRLLGWEVVDHHQKIKKWVRQIRDEVDVVIVLSHTGYSNDQKMAKEIEGIDIIIGAHTHHVLKQGEKINDTFIIQAGKFGKYIGRTTVEYDPASNKIISITGECIETEPFPPEPDIAEWIKEKEKEANRALNPPIVHLKHDLTINWLKESPLGNLLAEGIRKWVDAEVAMVNAGQLLFSLHKGPISSKDLLSVCPHPINACKLWLKGSDLKQILEESLLEANIYREVKGFGFRGKMIGWMCVDGMLITYDPKEKEGHRIHKIEVNGQALEEERIYSIGTVDMFTFGWLFPTFKKSPKIKYYMPEFIRDILSKELQKENVWISSTQSRWIQV